MATRAAAQALDEMLPVERLESEFAAAASWSETPPETILQHGAGWGALESERRARAGEPPCCSAGLVFARTSLGPEQEPWLQLLETDEFPESPPNQAPAGYLVADAWREMLEHAVAEGRSRHWSAWLHLGVMRWHAGDAVGAEAAWQASRAVRDTPWAKRNLAVLAGQHGEPAEAADLYLDACRACPGLTPLAVECAEALIAAGRAADWLDLLTDLSPMVRNQGRIRLLEARAALECGDLQRVGERLSSDLTLADLREGEQSLSELWFEYQAQRLAAESGKPVTDDLRERVRHEFPVPPHLDFRMSAQKNATPTGTAEPPAGKGRQPAADTCES
jgi:hypothetical protein